MPPRMESTTDKRKHQRFPITQRCWCESTNVTMYITILNISKGGVFLKTAIPLPVGQKARIIWKLSDDQEVEAEAEVVWSCQGGSSGPQGGFVVPGMGLRFTSVLRGEDGLEQFFRSLPPPH
jgi:uncharacterized protein (TIGR02266 family)